MGLLDQAFSHLENQRGRIKRRGLLDVFASNLGEIADKQTQAMGAMGSVMPEVAKQGREEMYGTGLGLLGAIKAYHGSPHKFDKFDLSKIGTGEGAQAYGHGLYFAESPKVALDYQRRLSGATGDFTYTWNGQQIPAKSGPEAHAVSLAFHDGVGTARRIAKEGLQAAQSGEPWALEMGGLSYWKKVDEVARAIKSKSEIKGAQGYMYETSLRWPDPVREATDPLGPQHFLQYDKPLKAQPAVVRNAVNDKLAAEGYGKGQPGFRAFKMERGGFGESEMDSLMRLFGKTPEEQASAARGMGVPGIRYLDAGSRDKGRGTHNYVMFDDALVEILRRNGLAP